MALGMKNFFDKVLKIGNLYGIIFMFEAERQFTEKYTFLLKSPLIINFVFW